MLMAFDFSGTIEQDEYDRCQSMTGIGALDPGAISNPDFDSGPWSCAGYDGSIYDDIADLFCRCVGSIRAVAARRAGGRNDGKHDDAQCGIVAAHPGAWGL